MWPYNHCEWKSVTYGISGAKKKVKQAVKDKTLFFASAIPSAILIVGVIYIVLGR